MNTQRWIVGRVGGGPLAVEGQYRAIFESEADAAQFIETLPDYETGCYYLDGPDEDCPMYDETSFPIYGQDIDQITLYGWPTFDGKIKLGPKAGSGRIIDTWPERIRVGGYTFSIEWATSDQPGYDDDYWCQSAVYYQDGNQ